MSVVENEHIEYIPLSEIFSDDVFNCRGPIIPFSVIELAKSIAEVGLAQPIMVQPFDKCPVPGQKYRIVLGHRRYLAHKVNKAEKIKCLVRTGLTEEQAFTLNYIENVGREDLNILQEAKGLERYKLWGYTQNETADKIKKSKGWVQVRFTLLELPSEIQQEAAAGIVGTENIKQLGGLTRDEQFEAVRNIKDARLRGERLRLKPKEKRKVNPYERKVRRPDQIQDMMTLIYDGVGGNLATRALAWASGNISDVEFLRDVKKHADDIGKPWSIPNYIIAAGAI